MLAKGNECLLNASSWKPGVYIIHAYKKDHKYSAKIVVK